jgi:hypothetical protein
VVAARLGATLRAAASFSSGPQLKSIVQEATLESYLVFRQRHAVRKVKRAMRVPRAKNNEPKHTGALMHFEAYCLVVLGIEQGRPLDGGIRGTHIFSIG